MESTTLQNIYKRKSRAREIVYDRAEHGNLMLSINDESDLKVESGLYVIKFWATWCGPCKRMDPSLKQLESEFEMIKFISIDVDQVPTLAQKFRVKTLPTILVIKDGTELNRIPGMSLIEPLRKIFREAAQARTE